MNDQNKFPFEDSKNNNYQRDKNDYLIPLELQFSLRRTEIAAQKMTKEQLYSALLNLYYQRLMEWHAFKELIGENKDLGFAAIPTDLDLKKLAEESSNEGDDEPPPF